MQFGQLGRTDHSPSHWNAATVTIQSPTMHEAVSCCQEEHNRDVKDDLETTDYTART